MLVYERKLKTLMKRIADPVLIEESKDNIKVLECENTALARAGEIYFDPQKKEYLTFTRFNNIVPKVPKNLYQEVWEDNNTLIFERQIYSAEFFNFVQEILNESYTLLNNLPTESANEMAISMMYISSSLISGILAHAYHNKPIDSITNQLIKLFKNNEAATNEFLLEFIKTMHTEYLHLLIKCPDKDVRETVSKLLAETLTIAIQRDKTSFGFKTTEEGPLYKSTIIVVLDLIVNMIEPKLAQDWNRFEFFFKLLLNVAKNGGESIVLYMNSRNLIAVLLDFYLANSSPLRRKKDRIEMGNKFENVKFRYLIDLLCYLVSYSNLTFLQPRYLELREKWNLPNILYELSEEAKICIQSKEFLIKTIFEGHTTEGFDTYLAILSYEARRFSKFLARNILNIINGDVTVDVNLCFNILKKIFSIEDSLQQERFEWLLGIPVLSLNLASITEEGLKYGLRRINALDDDVVDYISPLNYNDNFNSLLTLLWKFNKTFEIAPIKCLLDLMITNPKIFDYVVSMPPPTYQYAKYPDWIRPFVEAFIQNNQNAIRFPSYLYSIKKTEDSRKAQKYLEEYEKLWEDYANKQKKYTTRTDVLIGFPEPYIIGKIEEEKTILNETKEGINLKISELKTEVYKSLPMINANEGIPLYYAEKAKLKNEKLTHDSLKRVTSKESEVQEDTETFKTEMVKVNDDDKKDEKEKEEPLKKEMTILKIEIQSGKLWIVISRFTTYDESEVEF